MAHFNLQEQEELSKIKYFWKDYGKYIIGVIALAIVAYLINIAWIYKNTKDAEKAAILYAKFLDAANLKDNKLVNSVVQEMQKSYPKAEVTTMASIWGAKILFEAKDVVHAEENLKWVISNAKDKGLVAVAMLRLASIYLEQKRFDLAIKTLREEHDNNFDGLFYSKRGDVYLAKGDYSKARDAYTEALKKSAQDQSLTGSIQLKLDILGK